MNDPLVRLTIQVSADDEEEIFNLLTVARKKARALMALPQKPEDVAEEQFCSGAFRVTLERPGLDEGT